MGFGLLQGSVTSLLIRQVTETLTEAVCYTGRLYHHGGDSVSTPFPYSAIVRVSVTCLISNVVPNPCSRPKPTETRGHVIWSSGIAAMPILHSPNCPTALCKLQFPEPESDSNSRPMDRVALGCHKGSYQATALFQAMCLLPMDLHKTIHQ